MATTTSTPATTTTWKLDPAHSSRRVQGQAHDDLQREGQLQRPLRHPHRARHRRHALQRRGLHRRRTVSTGDAQRDAHLKSADFFDVEKYPTMTFKSTSVKPNGDGGYKVTGDLALHGVTKQITFNVDGPSAPGKDPWGNTRIGLSATAKISRKDFGLNWNAALETGGILVGDDVHITVEAQFIKA